MGSITNAQILWAQQSTSSLAFEGVTVIDVRDGRLLPEQSVVVTGNRIAAIGPKGRVRIPPGTQVVGAQGKYLIPGLWDMHTHIDMKVQVYPRFLAHGVTGVREMAQRFYRGPQQFRTWQQEVMAGTRTGPRSVGPSVDLTDGDYKITPAMLADVPRIIDSLKAAGILFLKYHAWNNDLNLYYAFTREARRAGLPLVGHVPLKVADIAAADSGHRSIEHMDNVRCWIQDLTVDYVYARFRFDPDSAAVERRCAQSAAAYIRNRTWIAPTLVTNYWLGAPARAQDALKAVRTLRRLGVTQFLAGSDATPWENEMNPRMRPGLSLLGELALLADAGLTPLEALQAATLNPAKFFNATDSLGTVTQGKLADLVLLDENPLANIRSILKIRAVVANGRYFDRTALDAMDPEGIPIVQQMFNELTKRGRIVLPAALGMVGYPTSERAPVQGVDIDTVVPGTPADSLGMAKGDIIVAIDGKPTYPWKLYLQLRSTWEPGQTVEVEIVRPNGMRRKVIAKLFERDR